MTHGDVYIMTDSFRSLLKRMNPEQLTHVEEVLSFYVNQFTALKATLEDNPLGLAAGLHEVLDRAIAEQRARGPIAAARIACRSGCSACCSQSVDVLPIEAALLYAYADDLDLTIDWARLARQRTAGRQQWALLTPLDRRCVFLQDDETCGVYAHRPMSCRKYFVIDDPRQCEGTQAWRWTAPSAEIIATAALTVFQSDHLPFALLAIRARMDEKEV